MILSELAVGLHEIPSYEVRYRYDKNVLSGHSKMRKIHCPNRGLRELHSRLGEYLASITPELPFATGCLPGCSPKANVFRHRHNRFFYLTDLHDAYGHVELERLAKVLTFLDSDLDEDPQDLQSFLSSFCFAGEDGLMTGGNCSPLLFNLYAGVVLDIPIGHFAAESGLVYTRYLDDITLSAQDGNPIGKRKRAIIRRMIEGVGFEISHQKSFVLDLAKAPITINGIGLEYGGRVFLSRAYLRETNGQIWSALKGASIDQNVIAGRMGAFQSARDQDAPMVSRELQLVTNFQAYLQKNRTDRKRAKAR